MVGRLLRHRPHFLFWVDNDIFFLFKEIKPDIELKNMFVFYCRAGVYLPPFFVPITSVFGGTKAPPYKHFLYLIQFDDAIFKPICRAVVYLPPKANGKNQTQRLHSMFALTQSRLLTEKVDF